MGPGERRVVAVEPGAEFGVGVFVLHELVRISGPQLLGSDPHSIDQFSLVSHDEKATLFAVPQPSGPRRETS